MHESHRKWGPTIALAILAPHAVAGGVTLPNSFTAGTPARATEVNANFTAVKSAVDDNHGRITTLEGNAVTSVGASAPLASSGGKTPNLSLAACAAGQVLKHNGTAWACAADADSNSGGTVTSITAGAGLTGGTITGSGTIAVDPASNTLIAAFHRQGGNAYGATAVLGTTDDQPLEIRVNGSSVMRYEPHATSPNVVGGHPNNYVTEDAYGATVAGGGGTGNDCIEPATGTLTRHCGNQANTPFGTVGGGFSNKTSGNYGTVSGGRLNTASGTSSTVAGGNFNSATGSYSTTAGGNSNIANFAYSTVAGGSGNTASSSYSTIGGGDRNRASGWGSVVAGGSSNTASGGHSFAAGLGNTASSHFTTVAGGSNNTASGAASTVGGGDGNTASHQYTTVSGGYNNTASGGDSTVAGGLSNTASGWASTIAGGTGNTASGWGSVAAGGANNTASGSYSFAAGRKAKTQTAGGTVHDGAFAWADSNNFDFNTAATNEFAARATGGVRFVTAIDGSGNPTAGVSLGAGSGAWNSLSDRAAKRDLVPVDGRAVLARVAALPLAEWSYRTEAEGVRHMGPMAQDFHAAFGLGTDDKTITTVDADGVALAAIQGLHQEQRRMAEELQQKDAEIAALQARLAAVEGAQRDELAALRQGLAELRADLAVTCDLAPTLALRVAR